MLASTFLTRKTGIGEPKLFADGSAIVPPSVEYIEKTSQEGGSESPLRNSIGSAKAKGQKLAVY